MRAPLLTFKRARSLRRQMTLPEVVLWHALRGGRMNGLRFRRQHPIGPYILDFFCPSIPLGIEIDGESHEHPDRARHDARRDEWLTRRRIRVLRFSATDVLTDDGLDAVLMTILEAATTASVDFGEAGQEARRFDPSNAPSVGRGEAVERRQP